MFTPPQSFPEGKRLNVRKLLYLPRVLSARERWFLYASVAILGGGIVLGIWRYWIAHTTAEPEYGGTLVEGVISAAEPRLFNPLYSPYNDVDRDVTSLIYSGLFTYNREGVVIPDLAESYEIQEKGKKYLIRLRKDVVWHDGEPFTARDVVYTIRAAQDKDIQSPIRPNWQEGITVEEIDTYTVQFTLIGAYAPFLENLTLGILPAHIWEQIPPQNAFLANINQQPIGTGPYRFKKLLKDRSTGSIREITLEANERYYHTQPYIREIVFRFFQDEQFAMDAFRTGKIQAVSGLSLEGALHAPERAVVHRVNIPWYFAVFFNQSQSKVLADPAVRKALTLTTNREALVREVVKGEGTPQYSPLLPWQLGYSLVSGVSEFSVEKARNILEQAGWKDANGDGIREKTLKNSKSPSKLAFTLVTRDVRPELANTAELLKAQWREIGADVTVEVVEAGRLDDEIIRPRSYQALLFGEALNGDPDLFSFWHLSLIHI